MNLRAVVQWFGFLGLAAVALTVAAGCKSPEQRNRNKVHYTELFFHGGAPGGLADTNRVMVVNVAGYPVAIQKQAFLTEVDLEDAEVVDSPGGGYALRLSYNDHGRLVLDTYAAANRGKQIAIFARYGVRKDKEVPLTEVWLAAPLMTRQIPDGIITFTPTVDKEELYRILDGLRNAIEVNHKPWVF